MHGYHKVILNTDNLAVSQSGKSRSFRIRNLFDRLSVDFPNVQIRHISSKQNVIADLFSRAEKCPIEDGTSDFFLKVPMCAVTTRSATRADAVAVPADTATEVNPDEVESSTVKPRSSGPSDEPSARITMLNKLFMFHMRGGHPSAERLFALYKRIFGKHHVSRVTLAHIKDRLRNCRCFTSRTKQSANFVPVFPSTNRELFLDFKEIGTNRCPLADGKKGYRLTVTEPLSGAVWSLPTPVCNGRELVRLMRIVLQIHGMVARVRPDNAPAFIHGEFADFCRTHSIEIGPIATYNAKANLAERSHSGINKLINLLETDSNDVDEDIFNFIQSYNILPKESGLSPLEVLKGGLLPAECVEEFGTVAVRQSDLSAKSFIEEAWQARNTSKLLKTSPNPVKPKFSVGQKVIWRAQVNPSTIKTASGVIVACNVTSALVRFSDRRITWCSVSQLQISQVDSIGKLLEY